MKQAEMLETKEDTPLHHLPSVQGMHIADTSEAWIRFFESARELANLARTRRKAREAVVLESASTCSREETA